MLTPEDEIFLKEIGDWEGDDPVEFGTLIMNYWGNLDRSERTSRAYMYLHIGMMVGTMMKMRRHHINQLEILNQKLREQVEKLERFTGQNVDSNEWRLSSTSCPDCHEQTLQIREHIHKNKYVMYEVVCSRLECGYSQHVKVGDDISFH